MQWGSLMEICGVATYLKYFPNASFKSTGIWTHDRCKWLGVSPDGLANEDIVIEIKCPFMNGNPFPYRSIPAQYVAQAQFEMYVTGRKKLHFVVWTPRTTKVYQMEMNERFIGLCLDELEVFHDSLKDDTVPDMSAISEELLSEAKEISKLCVLLGSYKSCRTPGIFSQPDFVYFTKEVNIKKKDKKCKIETCQEQAKHEYREPQRRSARKSQEYQAFTWVSGGIRNSCFIDSFLEVMFHVWMRLDMKVLPEALNESLVQCKNKNFHVSKMILWNFLNDNATSRYDTFDLGEMAAVTAVIDNLYQKYSTS